jgi:hypothetical protein
VKLFRNIFLFGLLAAAMGCDKEDQMPSRVQLLIRKDWKLQEFTSSPAYPFTVNGTVTTFTDIMAFYRTYNPCFLKEGYHFEVGPNSSQFQEGIYTYYQAERSCTPQAVKDTGRWYFQDAPDVILWRAQLNNLSQLKTSIIVDQLTYSKLTAISRIKLVTNGPIYELKRTFIPVN